MMGSPNPASDVVCAGVNGSRSGLLWVKASTTGASCPVRRFASFFDDEVVF